MGMTKAQRMRYKAFLKGHRTKPNRPGIMRRMISRLAGDMLPPEVFDRQYRNYP
jgi:hypothetical protein